MLELREVHLTLGRNQILRGVDMDASPADITVLLGPNGSGKSSLLKLVAGLHRPSQGTVGWQGDDITDQTVPGRLRSGITLVPQGKRLFGAMSVEDNLLMGAYARTGPKQEVRGDLDRWYTALPRLAELRHRAAGSLSGGEQQLAAIARGLMSRPTILLLDEPSIGVSPKVLLSLEEILRSLHRDEGLGFVIVEQNVGFALDIGQRIVVLKGGRLATVADPDALRDRTVLSEVYFGRSDPTEAASSSPTPSPRETCP